MSRLRELAEGYALMGGVMPVERQIAAAPTLAVLLADAKDALAQTDEAISAAAGTMNFYFGPGSRAAVSSTTRALYEHIMASRASARALLARIEELEGEALARFAGDRNPPA